MPKVWCIGYSMPTSPRCQASSRKSSRTDNGPTRLLRDENDKAAANSREKLHASLALLPVDPGQVDYLYGRLLDAAPHEVPVIRDALAPHKDALLDKLWAVVETPEKGKESQRLRAAAALAKYDPESEKWATVQEAVGNDLVAVPALHLCLVDGIAASSANELAPAIVGCLSRFRVAGKPSDPWQRHLWPTTLPTIRKCWPIC